MEMYRPFDAAQLANNPTDYILMTCLKISNIALKTVIIYSKSCKFSYLQTGEMSHAPGNLCAKHK